MNVVGLVDLTNDGAGDPDIYRDLDAAARALLSSGDPDPLLRLYAERTAFQENYFNTPASVYSGLLYQADSCTDYPQLYDMNDTPAQRATQLAAAVAALPADTFFPFTTQEWLDQDQNTEAYTSCAVWPSPVDAEPPTVGQPLLPPSIPVLILGGEFDTWTPPSDVPKVIAELGGNSRFIELANSTHVVGEGDTTCGDLLVQEFVESAAVPQRHGCHLCPSRRPHPLRGHLRRVPGRGGAADAGVFQHRVHPATEIGRGSSGDRRRRHRSFRTTWSDPSTTASTVAPQPHSTAEPPSNSKVTFSFPAWP